MTLQFGVILCKKARKSIKSYALTQNKCTKTCAFRIIVVSLHQKKKQKQLNPKTRKGREIMNTTVAKRISFQNEYKAKHSDKPIMLFRDMDFYFTYNEDAETVGQILGASGKVAHAEDFTYAAFSARKLDEYLPAIIRKGYHVAICDGSIC